MSAPPPPPPPPPPAPEPSTGGGIEDMAGALFAEINALGADGARAGLKKAVRGPVNEDTPTAAVQPKPAPAPAPAPAPIISKKTPTRGEPMCALVGKKWSVENQYDNPEVIINCESMKHTVYVYRCEKSTIQVKGKVNSISIDSCKKVDLLFEDALSQVEVVNSDSVRVQCTGNAPSINIDGCQSVTYIMSEQSVKNAMVITSKSAAINLMRPKPEDPEDVIETPIPEQFCTTFKDGQFVTEAVDHDD